MSCIWTTSDQPRVILGRHVEDCESDLCRGCQPCREPHCRVCYRTHADGTCAECMGATREALREIARMCDALPEEVEHRGVEGEAMMLLGPAADPEARGHLEASVASGRVPADYLDHADHERHPLFVLGTWSMTWRDALEHDDEGGYSLPELVDYLDQTMGYMGGYEHVPFEDFARDLRQCASHIEAVLHDGEQVDKGAPCMTCNVPLERTWGATADEDGWRCPRCRQTSTEDQYRFAVKHLHREEAAWLTDQDIELRTGVKASTVRRWASPRRVIQMGERVELPPLISKTRVNHAGRKLYPVAEVENLRDGRKASA